MFIAESRSYSVGMSAIARPMLKMRPSMWPSDPIRTALISITITIANSSVLERNSSHSTETIPMEMRATLPMKKATKVRFRMRRSRSGPGPNSASTKPQRRRQSASADSSKSRASSWLPNRKIRSCEACQQIDSGQQRKTSVHRKGPLPLHHRERKADQREHHQHGSNHDRRQTVADGTGNHRRPLANQLLAMDSDVPVARVDPNHERLSYIVWTQRQIGPVDSCEPCGRKQTAWWLCDQFSVDVGFVKLIDKLQIHHRIGEPRSGQSGAQPQLILPLRPEGLSTPPDTKWSVIPFGIQTLWTL